MNPSNTHEETSTVGPNNSNPGNSGLGQSNPLRTISNPTAFHGQGIATTTHTSSISKQTKPSLQTKSVSTLPKDISKPEESHVRFAATAKINVPQVAPSLSSKPASTVPPPPPPPPPMMKPTVPLRTSPITSATTPSSTSSQNKSSSTSSILSSRKNTAKSIMRKMKPSVPSSIAKTAKKTFGSSSSNNSNDNTSTSKNLTKNQLAQILKPNRSSSTNSTTTTKVTLSIDEETNQFLSPHSIHPPPLKSADSPLQTIQQLVQRRAWGDVLHFSQDFLTSQSYPYVQYYQELQQLDSTPPSIQKDDVKLDIANETTLFIAYRLQAMMKCKRYLELQREIASLHLVTSQFNRKNESNQTEPKTILPEWVPFGLVILAAQSLSMTNDSGTTNSVSDSMESKSITKLTCIDVLHRLQYDLEQLESSDEQSKVYEWKMRLDLALYNAFVQKEEYRMALDALDKVLMSSSLMSAVEYNVNALWKGQWGSLPDSSTSADENVDENEQMSVLSKICYSALRMELFSRQIRIFLQLGAISEAQFLQDTLLQTDYASFTQLTETVVPLSKTEHFLQQNILVRQISSQVYLNNGLLAFANLEYEDAMTHFQSAISTQRHMLDSSSSSSTNTSSTYGNHSHILSTGILTSLDLHDDPHILTYAFNNLALCSLYTCQVTEAVSMMEDFIKENPTLYLTETLVFNLCTLYELCADSAVSKRKKKILQGVAKRFFLHDISMENFRIG